MAYGRRRYGRRRGYRRRPNRKMFVRTRRIVRALVPRPEIKYKTFIFASAIDSNEIWPRFNEIAQGLMQEDRVGNKIRPVWLHIAGRVHMPDIKDEDPEVDIQETYNVLAGIGVIRDRDDCGGTPPAYATVYRAVDGVQVTSGPQAPFNLENAGRFKTLCKRRYFNLQVGGQNIFHFNMFKKFHPKTKPIMFSGAGNDNYDRNCIWVTLHTDQDSESSYKPIFNFVGRLAYTDA